MAENIAFLRALIISFKKFSVLFVQDHDMGCSVVVKMFLFLELLH